MDNERTLSQTERAERPHTLYDFNRVVGQHDRSSPTSYRQAQNPYENEVVAANGFAFAKAAKGRTEPLLPHGTAHRATAGDHLAPYPYTGGGLCADM